MTHCSTEMRPLVMYFNELSAPSVDLREEDASVWEGCAEPLFACLHSVANHRAGLRFAFRTGQWHSMVGAKPLSVWIRQWIGPTKYQWLLARLKIVELPGDLLIDVYVDGQRAAGLTLAHIGESWAFSFPLPNSQWLGCTVLAEEFQVRQTEYDSRPCVVSHLSDQSHATYWRQGLIDWGREVAENNVITTVCGLRVAMFPLDHGHPHVHLIAIGSNFRDGRPQTLAKFRVDQFCRMEGRPEWDCPMRDLIEGNRKELLESWERCKLGGHPFRIVEGDLESIEPRLN